MNKGNRLTNGLLFFERVFVLSLLTVLCTFELAYGVVTILPLCTNAMLQTMMDSTVQHSTIEDSPQKKIAALTHFQLDSPAMPQLQAPQSHTELQKIHYVDDMTDTKMENELALSQTVA